MTGSAQCGMTSIIHRFNRKEFIAEEDLLPRTDHYIFDYVGNDEKKVIMRVFEKNTEYH